MRNVDYKRARHFEVDLSAFRNILAIDSERMIARVEPLVNMGQITRVTVPMNLALAVVAELDDLTVGGLINGYGIEGSSHIYGLFADTVVAYEIVLADGQVVRATKDNEYCDLFYAIPWSQGTLGLLVSAEIKLIPIQKEFARRPKAEIPDVNLHEWWNVKRVAVFENLSIPDDYDVMSVEPGDDDSDAIYSVSEGIDDTEQIGGGLTETIYMLREADKSYWLGKEGGYRAQIKVSPEIYHCQHEWDQQNPLPEDRRPECTTCKRDLSSYSKAFCGKCNALTCALCAKHYFNLTTFITRKAPIPYNQKSLLQEQQEYIRWCEAEMKRLREEAIQYKTELEELKLTIQLQDDERELRRKGKYQEEELHELEKEAEAAEAHVQFEEVPTEKILAFNEVVAGEELKKKKKNMLYNLTVELEIPGSSRIQLHAILDTGATTCVVDSKAIPEEALEENTYTVEFNGINSKSKANKKLKGGKMYIGDNWFRIPYTYSFPFNLGGRIQMIIGCNFIRAMYGGVRIEGDNVTFYKNSFSLDKESQKKCYMLGARGLTIVWGDTPIYWAWRSLPWGSLPQSRFSEVAELVSVCWLDIKGKIETRLLSPKTTYVAFLVFKFVRANQGFESLPAKASVRLVGDEEEKSSTVYLKQPLTPVTSEGLSGRFPQERKDKWMEIQLGEFFNDQGEDGEVVMQLMEIERGNWKYGLVVEGIEIRPKIDT
ncbi:unnamed protein product [Camellia sinensis]